MKYDSPSNNFLTYSYKLTPVTIRSCICLEVSRRIALENSQHKPKVGLRYLNLTYYIQSHAEEKLEYFLKHFKNQHGDMAFTTEVEILYAYTKLFVRQIVTLQDGQCLSNLTPLAPLTLSRSWLVLATMNIRSNR